MYKEYYGFKVTPFSMTSDPRFYFSSKGHNRAIAYLQYGISQGEGFIVITGDVGAGKTTIVNYLLSQLDPESYIARQLVSTFLAENDLIEMLCESFGLPSDGLSKAALLKQLKLFFMDSYNQKKRIVLVVDEVQNLPLKTVEELRMLSNFQINNIPLIQSLLVGQKAFIETLQSDRMEQLRQRVTASCHLGSFKAAETEAYINFRLHSAGSSVGYLFNHHCCLLIHELTEGVPRRINVFCERILLYGFLENIKHFTEDHIRLVADELAGEITSPIKKSYLIEHKKRLQTPSKSEFGSELEIDARLSNESILDNQKPIQINDQTNVSTSTSTSRHPHNVASSVSRTAPLEAIVEEEFDVEDDQAFEFNEAPAKLSLTKVFVFLFVLLVCYLMIIGDVQ